MSYMGEDFLGDAPPEPLVAAPGTPPEPTQKLEEQAMAELVRHLSDPEWRMNNLYWVVDKAGNKVPFRMNAVQLDFFRRHWWRSVVPKSRQHGLSTLIALMMLDMCLFNVNKTGGIIDRTDLEGQKKLQKARFAYDHLDDPDNPSPLMAQLGGWVKAGVTITRANEHEIRFSNDSQMWTSPSLRGGTVQFLHISELGPIAYTDPKRAEEIRTGAFNTVHEGGRIVVESTHKGGRFGLFYELIDKARNTPEATATWQDWRLFFYGWHLDPANRISQAHRAKYDPPAAEKLYFGELFKNNIKLSAGQKEWWSLKKKEMGDFMSSEYPSTLEEMLDATIKGSIYGPLIGQLREQGRVTDFAPDAYAPLLTSWDLGQTDLTCIWLLQMAGPNLYILDYFSSCRQTPAHYARQLDEWAERYKLPIRYNFLPHDCEVKGGFGPSWRQELERAGVKNIVCVPKTNDLWVGINEVRRLLPSAYIHATNCSRPFESIEKQEIPSGLAALEQYRVEAGSDNPGEVVRERPVHDMHSHGADALRCFAEALSHGMVKGDSALERSVRNRVADCVTSMDDWYARKVQRDLHGRGLKPPTGRVHAE